MSGETRGVPSPTSDRARVMETLPTVCVLTLALAPVSSFRAAMYWACRQTASRNRSRRSASVGVRRVDRSDQHAVEPPGRALQQPRGVGRDRIRVEIGGELLDGRVDPH
jgi:hypothetical protein